MPAIDPKTLTAFNSPSNFNCLQIPQTPANKQTYVPFKYWHMHPFLLEGGRGLRESSWAHLLPTPSLGLLGAGMLRQAVGQLFGAVQGVL